MAVLQILVQSDCTNRFSFSKCPYDACYSVAAQVRLNPLASFPQGHSMVDYMVHYCSSDVISNSISYSSYPSSSPSSSSSCFSLSSSSNFTSTSSSSASSNSHSSHSSCSLHCTPHGQLTCSLFIVLRLIAK